MAAMTSANCGGFFNFRSDPDKGRVQISSSHGSSSSAGECGKLYGVAMWFINGVSAAFFASLERCSCVRIATVDDGEEGNDAPLILNDGNIGLGGGGSSKISRRWAAKGKKQSGAFDEY